MKRAIFVTITLAVALVVVTMPAVFAGPSPQLIRLRPDVEDALRQTLQAEGVASRIAHLAADSNGRLIVAEVTFTAARREESLEALQAFAGRIVWAALTRVPQLDELQITALEQDPTGRATTAPVIFAAAISREEFQVVSAHYTAKEVVRPLTRVWYSSAPRVRTSPPARGAVSPRRRVPMRSTIPLTPADIYRGDRTRPALALTFDDGPFPIYTTLLLDTLAQLGVKATFFLVGENVQEYPFLAQAIVQAGHEVANHSFHHPHLTQLSATQMNEELAQTQDILTALTGQSPRYFRPPYGEYSAALMRVAHNFGLSTVFWTTGGGDYASPSADALLAKVLKQADSGGILVLHQGVPGTIRLMPQMTEALAQRGFTFTTVGELLATRLSGAPGRRLTPSMPR
jgi:peptidoglycan/xylan/chitin deacetylase (PgdA/CDA1 family)